MRESLFTSAALNEAVWPVLAAFVLVVATVGLVATFVYRADR